MAVLNVIAAASAFTSSASTSGWKRMPPLPGPRVVSWWTRQPVNTSMRAVVHAHRHRHLEHALGRAEDAVDVGIEVGELGGVVESIEHGLPGVGGHVGCWPLPRAVVSARPDRSTRPARPESGYPRGEPW